MKDINVTGTTFIFRIFYFTAKINQSKLFIAPIINNVTLYKLPMAGPYDMSFLYAIY